jgi:FADH2 O2-dependent halogenase
VLADNTNNLAGRLLDCIRDNDFSVSRLEYVATSLKRAVQLNDRLVNCSYVALRHFRLWSAMLRVWLLGQGWGELRFIFANRNYELTGNQKFFDDLENVPYPGLLFPIMKEYKDLWEIATETVEAFEDGKITADAAADRLWLQLQRTQFGPPFMKIADPNYRWVKVSAKEMPEGLLWLRKQPPGPLKDFHFEGMRILARTLGVGQKV